MSKKKVVAAVEAEKKYAVVDPETGLVTCLGCRTQIQFLPEELPASGPNSVNHTGCPGATAGSSPAPANLDGLYETVNWIKRADVEAFYKRKAERANATP